jgi:phosphoglycerate dehydrogenase-like enzyme
MAMLAHHRHLPAVLEAQGRREWAYGVASSYSLLRGRTMTVLGAGAIGAQVATMARAFGMKVCRTRLCCLRFVL